MKHTVFVPGNDAAMASRKDAPNPRPTSSQLWGVGDVSPRARQDAALPAASSARKAHLCISPSGQPAPAIRNQISPNLRAVFPSFDCEINSLLPPSLLSYPLSSWLHLST